MKNPPNVKPEDQPRHLQQSYAETLRRRLCEFRAFLRRQDTAPPAPAEAENMHMRVRNLVGSGATYGYPGISRTALQLDNMLNGSDVAWNSKALADIVGKLIRVIEKSLEGIDSANREESPADIHSPSPVPASSRPILLTVDDDPAIHDLVAALLGDQAETVSAYSGDEAFQAMHDHNPDLILLDNVMPGLNGFALLDRMWSDRIIQHAPIMMLTADKQPHARMRALSAGVVDYITKPFDPNSFAEKVNGFLNRFHMTVLIASENAFERKQLSERLILRGLDVVEAADGEEALAMAESHIPELIILDECLQGSDGGDTLHDLRLNNHTRFIPVLRLTVNRHSDKGKKTASRHLINHPAIPFIADEIVTRAMKMMNLDKKSGSNWFPGSCNPSGQSVSNAS